MQGLAIGFTGAVLFALSVIGVADIAAAQDMPPILAPPAAPAVSAPKPPSAPPSAEAVIAPAVPATPPAAAPPSAKKPQVAAATAHPTQTHRHAKFAALMKRLTAARTRAQHEAATRRVGLRRVEPSFPPGPMPPPGYYPPSYRQHLVYGGPPPGFYGWGGYRERYPYDYP